MNSNTEQLPLEMVCVSRLLDNHHPLLCLLLHIFLFVCFHKWKVCICHVLLLTERKQNGSVCVYSPLSMEKSRPAMRSSPIHARGSIYQIHPLVLDQCQAKRETQDQVIATVCEREKNKYLDNLFSTFLSGCPFNFWASSCPFKAEQLKFCILPWEKHQGSIGNKLILL